MKTCFHSHLYVNFHASVTAIFVQIFMKFSPKCRTKKLGMIYTILGSFCSFLIGEEPIFGPTSDLGKSLLLAILNVLAHTCILIYGPDVSKPVFGGLRTTQAQTSLGSLISTFVVHFLESIICICTKDEM